MKKLSREERIGAIALFAVMVIAVSIAFWVRSIPSVSSSNSEVTVIYVDTLSSKEKEDRLSDDASEDSRKKKSSKRAKKSSSSKKNKKKSSRKSISNHVKTPPRDFLSDTIPTIRK